MIFLFNNLSEIKITIFLKLFGFSQQ